ncbi:unnamed protein product [Didymodactylos carnosus]|uniref:Uncharacterized protein n=1 Tax=Didymodactylos carnosus TaxID=1234261 RepID=A0A815NM65_9BILA|nr:unnamed protein product [Didymodactylos carnosus]CAF4316554.1 unnamed protein product [Didymodactylos carnosus]
MYGMYEMYEMQGTDNTHGMLGRMCGYVSDGRNVCSVWKYEKAFALYGMARESGFAATTNYPSGRISGGALPFLYRSVTCHNLNFQQQRLRVPIIDNCIEETHRPSSNDSQHQYNIRSSTRPPQAVTTAPLPIQQLKNPSEHYPRTKFRHY